jgi:hypothetical protein
MEPTQPIPGHQPDPHQPNQPMGQGAMPGHHPDPHQPNQPMGQDAMPGQQYPPMWQPTMPGQMYPPPPQYGAPYGYGQPVYQPAPVPTNGMAVASLIISIIAYPLMFIWGIGIVFAIIGVILGHIAYNQQKRAAQPTGMAIAGLVLGYIGIGLGVICGLSSILLFGAALNIIKYLPTLTPTPMP